MAKLFKDQIVKCSLNNQKWYGTVMKTQGDKVLVFINDGKDFYHIFDRKDVKNSFEW